MLPYLYGIKRHLQGEEIMHPFRENIFKENPKGGPKEKRFELVGIFGGMIENGSHWRDTHYFSAYLKKWFAI